MKYTVEVYSTRHFEAEADTPLDAVLEVRKRYNPSESIEQQIIVCGEDGSRVLEVSVPSNRPILPPFIPTSVSVR